MEGLGEVILQTNDFISRQREKKRADLGVGEDRDHRDVGSASAQRKEEATDGGLFIMYLTREKGRKGSYERTGGDKKDNGMGGGVDRRGQGQGGMATIAGGPGVFGFKYFCFGIQPAKPGLAYVFTRYVRRKGER